MARRILLQGGTAVTPQGVERLDILIDGERITATGVHLAGAPGTEVRDIRGLTVLPGLIDVHTHLREPGGEYKEDFTTGTSAALAGGVTTVFAMPNTSPPITNQATFEGAAACAAEKAVCDYGLYIGATPENAEEAAALSGQAAALKMYVGSSTGSLLVDRFPAQIAHFEHYPRDRIIAVHAEDESAVQYYAARGQHRPSICAVLSTAYVLALAEQTGRRVHICHVSTPHELMLIRDARGRGLRVTCEVTPHHFFLTTDDWARLGAQGKVNPPLRTPQEVEGLWALSEVIDMVATDHAPHTLEEKQSVSPPSGLPGLEAMLPLLLTAVHEGRLTLPDVARWTAQRPAEVFGIARKGRIAIGYDADLTLVDLNAEWVISNEGLYTRCGWTPFAGRTVCGRVAQVYLRGRLAFADGRVLAAPGSGRAVAFERV